MIKSEKKKKKHPALQKEPRNNLCLNFAQYTV